MDKKSYDRCAKVIGTEMNKFNEQSNCESAANFGFITQDGSDYRLFMGGRLDIIMEGIALGIATIIQMTGEDEDVIANIASDALAILDEGKNRTVC